MELVSVVVGTYNGSVYITEQLQSIVDQSYSNIEIIVVDDASTDNTLQVVAEFQQDHPQVKLHSFDNNLGYIKNFERGISLAKGNLIALSDQDDWWHPEKIEKLVNHLGTFDLCYCNSEFVDAQLNSSGTSFADQKNLISVNSPLDLLIENCISGHAAIFRSSLFNRAQPFPDHIPHDWWIAYISSTQNGATFLDEALVKYRIHGNNIIASRKSSKKKKSQKMKERRYRMKTFFDACPGELKPEKALIANINSSYENLSVYNGIKRVTIFGQHHKALLKVSKRKGLKRILLILSMLFTIK